MIHYLSGKVSICERPGTRPNWKPEARSFGTCPISQGQVVEHKAEDLVFERVYFHKHGTVLTLRWSQTLACLRKVRVR